MESNASAKHCIQREYLAFLGSGKTPAGHSEFLRASTLVYQWARAKVDDCLSLPTTPVTISLSNHSQESTFSVIYDPENLFFTLRIAMPDDMRPDLRRSVDVEIRSYYKQLAIAVRSAAALSRSFNHSDVWWDEPDFWPALIRDIGLNDGLPFGKTVWSAQESDTVRLADLILSEQRQLPLVMISQAKNPSVGVNGFLVDAVEIAQELGNSAHVVTLSWDATYALTQRLGADWSCYNGAVRLYWPELNPLVDAPKQHPLFTPYILRLNSTSQIVEDFKKLIVNHRRRIRWSDYQIEFYVAAEHSRFLRLNTAEKTAEQYRQQLNLLYQTLQEYQTLAEDSYSEMIQAKNRADTLEKQVAALTKLASKQRMEIAQLQNDKVGNIPTNWSYDQMDTWIARYYPDRLLLHPRAIRSLKNAVYHDSELVYRCLILLAEDYHAFRTGKCIWDEFIRRCKAVDAGLTEVETMSEANAGEHYYIDYQGRRVKLESHIKKGNSRDARYCLRIYFYWDSERSLVVLGSLPGHLSTRES